MQSKYDVIVVGAGMVGLASALRLAQKGLRVAVLESQSTLFSLPQPNDPFDSKVVAISRASEQLFEELGVWESMKHSRVSPYEQMAVWDSVCDGLIHFNAHEIYEPNLGHIVEQQVILGALSQAVKAHPDVDVFLNVVLETIQDDTDYIEVDCAGNKLRATLLIAADGAHSSVRAKMNIDTSISDYQQSAIVATIRGTKPHHRTAYQRFASDGPLAWLPLYDPYLTSIVWSTTPAEAKRLCLLSEEEFNLHLTRESEGKLGDLMLLGKRFCFPLKAHHVKQYVINRCALVGDAAHTLHPLAGMGVNLGFLDVKVLIDLVHEGSVKKRDFGLASWLKRYERRRRWHNQMMISMMGLFKGGFGSQSNTLQFLRNKALNYVQSKHMLKQFFVRQALATNYL